MTKISCKERGIIFSSDMVKAILDWLKTQTRRVFKEMATANERGDWLNAQNWSCDGLGQWWAEESGVPLGPFKCPYGVVGDRLWVRETWASLYTLDDLKPSELKEKLHSYLYKADGPPWKNGRIYGKWRPPRFMCKFLARIWLEITNIRVERLQSMSFNDWVADFCPDFRQREEALGTFVGAENQRRMAQEFWDSLNAKRGYGWEKNTWVWVIEFKQD